MGCQACHVTWPADQQDEENGESPGADGGGPAAVVVGIAGGRTDGDDRLEELHNALGPTQLVLRHAGVVTVSEGTDMWELKGGKIRAKVGVKLFEGEPATGRSVQR